MSLKNKVGIVVGILYYLLELRFLFELGLSSISKRGCHKSNRHVCHHNRRKNAHESSASHPNTKTNYITNILEVKLNFVGQEICWRQFHQKIHYKPIRGRKLDKKRISSKAKSTMSSAFSKNRPTFVDLLTNKATKTSQTQPVLLQKLLLKLFVTLHFVS